MGSRLDTDAKPDLLIVGAGAYACGSLPNEFGTVLPTALGLQKEGRINRIRVAASRPSSARSCLDKIDRLGSILGMEPDVDVYPKGIRRDPDAYHLALADSPEATAAIVVVPDSLHHRVTSELLDRRVDCLVVKPLAPSTAQARDLATRARESGVIAQVEFHKRFDDANRLIQRELRRGSLGNLSSILVEYSQRRSMPLETFLSWSHESHPFQYLGVHYVDLIYAMTGATPIRAMAVGTSTLLASHEIDSFDSVQAIVEWQPERGECFHSVFATSWIDPEATTAMSNQVIKVIGTEGRLDSDQKNRGLDLTTARGHEAVNPYFCQLLPEGEDLRLEGYGPKSITNFVEDVRARLAGIDRPSIAATFDDAIVSTSVCEAVSRSLHAGGAWFPVATTTEHASRPRRPAVSVAAASVSNRMSAGQAI